MEEVRTKFHEKIYLSIYLSINFLFNHSCFNLLDKKTPSQQALEAIHSHSSGALLGSRGLRSLAHTKKTTSISGKKSFFASLGDSFELSVLNTGTDIFCFPQFEGSPHVRYDMIWYVTNFSLHRTCPQMLIAWVDTINPCYTKASGQVFPYWPRW